MLVKAATGVLINVPCMETATFCLISIGLTVQLVCRRGSGDEICALQQVLIITRSKEVSRITSPLWAESIRPLDYPHRGSVMWSIGVFFAITSDKLLAKRSNRWFETPWRSYAMLIYMLIYFHPRIRIWKTRLRNVGNFVSVSINLTGEL